MDFYAVHRQNEASLRESLKCSLSLSFIHKTIAGKNSLQKRYGLKIKKYRQFVSDAVTRRLMVRLCVV